MTSWIKGACLGTALCWLSSSAALAQDNLPPLSAIAVASGAQITHEYGHEFVTVGAPGNAPFVGGPLGANAGLGSVATPFRIARTEVTNAQLVAFANAYLPHIQGDPARQWGILGSGYVQYDRGLARYVVTPGAEQFAANMSWRTAARYCNWLCNNQGSDAAAFTNGAYDTATFGDGPNRTFTDQRTHNPGARFYIPTLNQWLKAAYFDPNHSGPGAPGYWRYPNATDTELRYAFPQDNGESIAGLQNIPPNAEYLPVASYTTTQSPWGLFDLSGSTKDWNENADDESAARAFSGSDRRDIVPGYTDSLFDNYPRSVYPGDIVTFVGFRVASQIPAPSSFVLFGIAGGACLRRKTRRESHE